MHYLFPWRSKNCWKYWYESFLNKELKGPLYILLYAIDISALCRAIEGEGWILDFSEVLEYFSVIEVWLNQNMTIYWLVSAIWYLKMLQFWWSLAFYLILMKYGILFSLMKYGILSNFDEVRDSIQFWCSIAFYPILIKYGMLSFFDEVRHSFHFRRSKAFQ